MTFLSELTKLGISSIHAQLLESHYGNQHNFTDGLDQIAAALAFDSKPDPKPPTAEPWYGIHTRMMITADGIQPAFTRAIDAISNNDLAQAVQEATLIRVTTILNTQQHVKIGSTLGAAPSQRITSTLLESPDEQLVKDLRQLLLSKGQAEDQRKRNAAAHLLNWLDTNGKLVRTPHQELFYLYEPERKVYGLDTERWRAWLYNLTGLVPSGKNFAAMESAVKSACILNGDEIEVVRLAHFDKKTQTLRVSRFDGTVYVLDGAQITEEINGDGPVLFDDWPMWEPYTPDFSGETYLTDSCLEWSVAKVPNWDSREEKQTFALRAWTLSLFFSEYCPPKPLLVMLGEKGSGKSMALRVLLKLLFGGLAEISGLPDKPDGFVAAASHQHVYMLDNLDTITPWLRDKLARITTGGVDQYRRLYTSNEMGVVVYRCWIACTARTPDTLRRDDLADRLLILRVARIADDLRKREGAFLDNLLSIRDAWWGDVLTALNTIVAEMRKDDAPVSSPLRMADWEILGRMIAQTTDKLKLWDEFILELKLDQAGFVAEGDCVVEAVEAWLSNPANIGREVQARILYHEAQEKLWPYPTKPDRNWPKSVNWFGRRMQNVKEYFVQRYGMKDWHEQDGQKYQFMGKPII